MEGELRTGTYAPLWQHPWFQDVAVKVVHMVSGEEELLAQYGAASSVLFVNSEVFRQQFDSCACRSALNSGSGCVIGVRSSIGVVDVGSQHGHSCRKLHAFKVVVDDPAHAPLIRAMLFHVYHDRLPDAQQAGFWHKGRTVEELIALIKLSFDAGFLYCLEDCVEELASLPRDANLACAVFEGFPASERQRYERDSVVCVSQLVESLEQWVSEVLKDFEVALRNPELRPLLHSMGEDLAERIFEERQQLGLPENAALLALSEWMAHADVDSPTQKLCWLRLHHLTPTYLNMLLSDYAADWLKAPDIRCMVLQALEPRLLPKSFRVSTNNAHDSKPPPVLVSWQLDFASLRPTANQQSPQHLLPLQEAFFNGFFFTFQPVLSSSGVLGVGIDATWHFGDTLVSQQDMRSHHARLAALQTSLSISSKDTSCVLEQQECELPPSFSLFGKGAAGGPGGAQLPAPATQQGSITLQLKLLACY